MNCKVLFFPQIAMCFWGPYDNQPFQGWNFISKSIHPFRPGNQQLLGAYNEIAKFEEAAGVGVE